MDDNEELPVELAAIKAEIKRNAVRSSSVDNAASSLAPIELKITLRPHPEDETGRSCVYSHTMKRVRLISVYLISTRLAYITFAEREV